MNARQDYDVVIAGGGMIGVSLALALAPLGLRVAVVEAVARTAEQQPSFDDRSTALSRSSQRTFEALGLWPAIVAAATPISQIHVSDKGRFGFSHIDAAEQQVEALGYVVINRVLGDALQSALAAASNVEFICPARITALDQVAGGVVVTADENGRESRLATQLLVAADGAGSTVREMLGIGARFNDYGQHAVIGNLLTEKPHAHCAYERFTDNGPLALLPMTDERMAFVWTLSPGDAEALMQSDDAAVTGLANFRDSGAAPVTH